MRVSIYFNTFFVRNDNSLKNNLGFWELQFSTPAATGGFLCLWLFLIPVFNTSAGWTTPIESSIVNHLIDSQALIESPIVDSPSIIDQFNTDQITTRNNELLQDVFLLNIGKILWPTPIPSPAAPNNQTN